MKTLPTAGFVWLLGWLCALAIGASGQASSPSQPQAKVSGGLALSVIDSSWAPVARAKITITDANGVLIANGLTDRLGKFSISQIPIGGYLATASLEGYSERSVTFLVREHHVTEFAIHAQVDQLNQSGEPAAASPKGPETRDARLLGDSAFTLTVKDPTGAVIPGTTVSVEQSSSDLRVEGKTDSVGVFRLADLAAGKYAISVVARGFQQEKFWVELHVREDLHRAVTLQVGSIVIRDGVYPDIRPEPIVSKATPDYLQEMRSTESICRRDHGSDPTFAGDKAALQSR
jgi:hypothetical protein